MLSYAYTYVGHAVVFTINSIPWLPCAVSGLANFSKLEPPVVAVSEHVLSRAGNPKRGNRKPKSELPVKYRGPFKGPFKG